MSESAANHLAESLSRRAARAMCRQGDRGLFFAFQVLPPARRDAACAIIAFTTMMRRAIASAPPAAGAVDDAPSAAEPSRPSGHCAEGGDSLESRLALLEARIDSIYNNRIELADPAGRSPEQHVLHALHRCIHDYQLPRSIFADFIEAAGLEAAAVRLPTGRALERYCARSGGSVALAIACVLGMTHPDARTSAIQLGSGLRLARILQNLGADVSADRLFLPLEDLSRFRCGHRQLSGQVLDDNLRRLIRFEADRARAMIRDGARGIACLAGGRSRLLAGCLAAAGEAMLRDVCRAGHFPHTPPPIDLGQGLRILARGWTLSRPGGRIS